MSKELFNIYDIVVFEDENGITQDCVCVIGKDKEADKRIDTIECNNHSISIYEDGNYKVWEKDGKDLPYYATDKKIIHLYTLKNDNRFYEVYPTNDYEDIDNANLSEALQSLIRIDKEYADITNEDFDICYDTIKQTLFKAQSNEEILQKYYQEGITLDSVRALKQERDNYKRVLEIIKGKVIWVENGKLMCGRYADTEIELEEDDFEDKKEFNLLKEWLG